MIEDRERPVRQGIEDALKRQREVYRKLALLVNGKRVG